MAIFSLRTSSFWAFARASRASPFLPESGCALLHHLGQYLFLVQVLLHPAADDVQGQLGHQYDGDSPAYVEVYQDYQTDPDDHDDLVQDLDPGLQGGNVLYIVVGHIVE